METHTAIHRKRPRYGRGIRTVDVTWEIDGLSVSVVCSVSPGSPGRHADMNGPGAPAEPPEVEILDVLEDDGTARPDLMNAAQRDFDVIEALAVGEAVAEDEAARDEADDAAFERARDARWE